MSVNIEISQSINILQIIIILLPFLSYFKVYLVFFPQKSFLSLSSDFICWI